MLVGPEYMGHCATERTPDLPDVPVMDWMTGNGVDRDKTWITSDTYHSVAANIVIYADAVSLLTCTCNYASGVFEGDGWS